MNGRPPLDEKKLWASNGFDRYRPRRDRSTIYLVLACLVFWGFALLGIAVLLIEIIRWLT